MDDSQLRFLARYPFVRRSRDYVGSLKMPLEELLSHPVYGASLEFGERRVIECLEGRFRPDFGDPLRCQLTILSYPVARMLGHSLGRSAAGKYAQGEAEAAFSLLSDERDSVAFEIAEDLGLRVHENSMPFVQYVSLSSSMARQNPRWKLTNRSVDRGLVEVDASEVRVLLREAVRNRVLEALDLKKVPDAIRKRANALKVQLSGEKSQMGYDSFEYAAMPPCMKSMAAALEAGLASHASMFMLATFLSNLGLGLQDILRVYSKSPKFDEEKTRYQLAFITGERGGTEYTCPACASIRSQGLCKAECGTKHPLQYYRRHASRRGKAAAKGSSPPADGNP